MLKLFRISACLIALVCVTSQVRADEPVPPPADNAPKKPAVSTEEVQALLQQLESGKYKERVAATKSLMEAGKVAIGPVTKAAHTDDLELGARCIDILKHLYKTGDAATKAEAEKSLKTLQQSKHKSVAKEAGDALRPANANNPFGGRNPFGGQAGGIQIQIGGFGGLPAAGGRFRMTTRNVNGNRQIDIDENGRKITITDQNKQNIHIKVTETVNGKVKTSEYKGKDLADLKKNHPDGAKIYERFAVQKANAGRVRLGFGRRVQVLPVPGGLIPPANNRNANNARAKAAADFTKANNRLKAAIESLRKYAASGNAKPEDLKKLSDEIEQAKGELERAVRNLRP